MAAAADGGSISSGEPPPGKWEGTAKGERGGAEEDEAGARASVGLEKSCAALLGSIAGDTAEGPADADDVRQSDEEAFVIVFIGGERSGEVVEAPNPSAFVANGIAS